MVRLSGKAQRQIRNALIAMLSPADFGSAAEWDTAVMQSVMPLTGAYKAAVRHGEGTDFQMTPCGFEESAIREHREYYHKFDFGQALGGPQVRSSVFSRNAFYADFNRLVRSEYYSDYLSRYRVLDALCISSRMEHHEKGTVLYLWHAREMSSTWRSEALQTLTLLEPAFRAAAAIVSSTHRRSQPLSSIVDSSLDGCALFTKGGTLLHMNPALSSMLEQVEFHAGLSSAISATVLSVQQILFSRSADICEAPPASLEYHAGESTYRISASALSSDDGESTASILVTVKRLETDRLPNQRLLAERFDLTARETEVAALLAIRCTNHEIAEHLGVSEHTARHHTENVMRKLDVSDRRHVTQILEASGRTGSS